MIWKKDDGRHSKVKLKDLMVGVQHATESLTKMQLGSKPKNAPPFF